MPGTDESERSNGHSPANLLKQALFTGECWIGERITQQICGHHQRRLRRIGQAARLDPPTGGWAPGPPPPREGNAIEILIDGERALPAIADELRGARRHVHLAGWHFSPDFALKREGELVVLRMLLADLAERIDVRILVWAGAPLPLFRPSRRDVRSMREQLVKHTRIQCALDAKERPMHCHHEKTIVIDDRVAFVGGIDLTSESGDRYDSSAHPSRSGLGWHDACARLEGPAVGDVAEHFRMRWHEVTSEHLDLAEPQGAAGDTELQIVRTVPEKVYGAVPNGDFTILESYLRAFKAAERLIYIENQFLWSPEIEAVLQEKIANPPHKDFRMVLLLPSRPNTGADDTRGVLGHLIEADDGRGNLLACTLYARSGNLREPVYVHAKIAIVDDAWLTLGSANLNEHSLFNDTEMNIVTHDRSLAKETRLRLFAEHLEMQLADVPVDSTEAIDALWKPISKEQLNRRAAGRPLTHRLVGLPHLSRRSSRALGPITGLLVDG
jgi:phosphatidylserine/phosphatidylglycerophosphate/cardiolipin synthase-like enzyme